MYTSVYCRPFISPIYPCNQPHFSKLIIVLLLITNIIGTGSNNRRTVALINNDGGTSSAGARRKSDQRPGRIAGLFRRDGSLKCCMNLFHAVLSRKEPFNGWWFTMVYNNGWWIWNTCDLKTLFDNGMCGWSATAMEQLVECNYIWHAKNAHINICGHIYHIWYNSSKW